MLKRRRQGLALKASIMTTTVEGERPDNTDR